MTFATVDGCCRDDRTRRALAGVVGETRADASLTHFWSTRIEVWVAAEILDAENGFLATTAILNMVSRFAGAVELRVEGPMTPMTELALAEELRTLKKIDSRDGHTVRHVSSLDVGVSAPEARVIVGVAPLGIDGFALNSTRDIFVAFDGWSCRMRRGGSVGDIVGSTVPFGALSAACFAAAEVFKTLITQSVPSQDLAAFKARFTHDWRFSAWTMERLDTQGRGAVVPPEVDPLPPLRVDSVLQVGAGAVGNATALTFASTPSIFGELSLLDSKVVDLRNLNRCYYFLESDVGLPKVAVLERKASRAGLRVHGFDAQFTASDTSNATIILSTVDNNDVRHRMQEALPALLVEGATGATTVAVSVHTPGNGRSCLVCRHPDPTLGLSRQIALTPWDTAEATGLTVHEVESGRVDGTMTITDGVLERVATASDASAAILREARDAGKDLCGALGDLRRALGTIKGPREASVPFVSNLAGVLASAEVVKRLLRGEGIDAPVLDNVLQIDLARDYSRHVSLAFGEPPRSDCSLCQARAELVAMVFERRKQRA